MHQYSPFIYQTAEKAKRSTFASKLCFHQSNRSNTIQQITSRDEIIATKPFNITSVPANFVAENVREHWDHHLQTTSSRSSNEFRIWSAKDLLAQRTPTLYSHGIN